MQKFSLIASVSDLGLLGGLAVTPRRLALAAALATVAVFVYAFTLAGFVQHRSASVGLNVVLISGQFFLVLGGAYIQAMWLGSRVFGDAWRRRTFLGERGKDEDMEIGALRDYSLHFYGLFGLALVATYATMAFATDDYVGRYNVSGYYETLFRSSAPEQRIEALRGLVDPVREESAQSRDLRERVVSALADEDSDVRAWAAWTSGQLTILEAAPDLVRVLIQGEREEQIEAAVALGRIRDPDGERRMIGMLPSALADPELAQALVTGLGLIPSTDALPVLLGMLGAVPESVEVPALWAIGRARTTSVREPILQRWETSEGTLRCAYAEALKHVTSEGDYAAMRDAFDADERSVCEAVLWAGRQYDPEHPLPPVVYVVPEELRVKYMKAAFNIGGPGLETWLVDTAWASGETDALRIQADQLAEALRGAPSRLPRQ